MERNTLCGNILTVLFYLLIIGMLVSSMIIENQKEKEEIIEQEKIQERIKIAKAKREKFLKDNNLTEEFLISDNRIKNEVKRIQGIIEYLKNSIHLKYEGKEVLVKSFTEEELIEYQRFIDIIAINNTLVESKIDGNINGKGVGALLTVIGGGQYEKISGQIEGYQKPKLLTLYTIK